MYDVPLNVNFIRSYDENKTYLEDFCRDRFNNENYYKEIEDIAALERNLRDISGFRIRLPMIDINTVGAGGGSIAYIENDGLLKVGPISAGAVPGPACYNLGGEQPTVSDANLILGRLPENLVGGRMKLNKQKAINSVKQIAKKLNVSNEEVVDMNRRMTNHDQSLNAPIGKNEGESGEWQDLLADERQDQEQQISYIQELNKKKKLMEDSLNFLKDREKDIIVKRRLSENPKTLEDLSKEYNVSRERIRQIETREFEKLQEIVKNKAIEQKIV